MARSLMVSSNKHISQRPFGSFESVITNKLPILADNVDLHTTSLQDIQVFSDAKDIIEQLDLIDFTFEIRHQNLTVCYLTELSSAEPRLFEKNMPCNPTADLGIMAISRDLNSFMLFGPRNISSLVGVLLGIRAFEIIQNHWLGIHSSSLYDTLTKKIHLIYGQTTSGKTSSAFLLEQASNKRLIVLNDDWNEVNLRENTVTATTKFLGEPRDERAYRYLSSSAKFTRYSSPGAKVWYLRDSPPLQHSGALGCIFQLDVKSRIQDDIYIHRKNNAHIPFMNSNLEKPIVSEELQEEASVFGTIVMERISKLIEGYLGLANSKTYHLIDAGSADPRVISNKILNIFRHEH